MTAEQDADFGWIIWPFGAGRKQVGLCFTGGDPDIIFDLPTEQAETLDRIFSGGTALADLTRQRDEARAELEKTKGARLLSVIFGHHEGAPKPFALQRTDRSLVALGAEFPDGAVALRLANDGGWTTKSDGGADGFAASSGLEVLWLSDELEPLAETEAKLEAAEAKLERQAPVIEAASLLWALYEAWGESASVEPTNEQQAAGWVELISLEDSKRLDLAFSAIDDRAAEIHAALRALGPVNPEASE